jgi:hypothetical protein
MRNAFYITIICAISLSCASMGTTQKIANKAALDSVKTICLGPYRFNEAALAVIDSVYSTFDTTLLNGLRRCERFEKILPWDSLKLVADRSSDSATVQLFGKAKEQGLDGILFCDLEIFNSSYMFIPLHDAKVTMRLHSTTDQSLILSIRFNTKTGKSYLLPQDHSTVTKDAVEAAVNAFVKHFKKAN